MIRLFNLHNVRKQTELEEMWDVTLADGRTYTMLVPGCWEQHPDLVNYRGKATYVKKINLNKDTNVRLEFKGVSHTADVYFDNEFVVHHYNAYTPFAGIIKNVKAGEHVIRVEIDNSFNEGSALHVPNDYYTYGGITRPVALEEVGDAYIENMHFTPKRAGEAWEGKIEVRVHNVGKCDRQLKLVCLLAGKELVTEAVIKAGALETIELNSIFKDVEAWSMSNPKLYELNTMLEQNGVVIDDYIDRVGFRAISLKDNRICLNGEPVFLLGFNRHEDYGNIGCAIPPQLMAQDLDLMQDMGANSVRTCHYPNDERFLDMCDERGILVWEENHARGLELSRMQNPNFEKQCEDCIAEMIEKHYNHPSIVIWGILNECESAMEDGRRMYKKQYEQIKSLDTTRPTTSATCRHFTDICLDLPDVVSFNIYSGWYEDVPVIGRHNDEMEWIEKNGGAGKPVIVSEFGAGAIYGFRDRTRSKWSEERQADILHENFEVYKNDNRLTGIYIWQFCDCRVTEEEWFAARPKSHNNKGIVDEYRRPKEAYDTVKQAYTTWNMK